MTAIFQMRKRRPERVRLPTVTSQLGAAAGVQPRQGHRARPSAGPPGSWLHGLSPLVDEGFAGYCWARVFRVRVDIRSEGRNPDGDSVVML